MSRKLDLIKRIVAEHPVSDPNGALQAICDVLASKNPKPDNLLTLTVDQISPDKVAVSIKFNRKKLQGKHIDMVHSSIDQFADDTFGSACEDCDPMKAMVRDASAQNLSLKVLFEKFEAEAHAAAMKGKGN